MLLFKISPNSKPDNFEFLHIIIALSGHEFFSKTPLVGEAPVIFFQKNLVATDRQTEKSIKYLPRKFFFFFFKFLQIECSRLRSYIELMWRISVIAARSIFCITSSDRIAQYRMTPFYNLIVIWDLFSCATFIILF